MLSMLHLFRGKNLWLPDLSVEENTLQSGTTFAASIVVCSLPFKPILGHAIPPSSDTF